MNTTTMSELTLAPYLEQKESWPQTGRHIMAQYDNESIWVYQAYCPEIAVFALEHQRFGGAFKYSRMSWIKPNFLWMMSRSGWARKQGQEYVLAVRLRREFFDQILASAVPSSYSKHCFSDHAEWKAALEKSSVRLQWDPDHDPYGGKLERRAIQLGLRDESLCRYGKDECLEIIDVTAVAREQHASIADGMTESLQTPIERVYLPRSRDAASNVGISKEVVYG